VPEMNYAGQLAGEVARVLPGARIKRVFSFNGQPLTPADILAEI
jgi:hypothetical protein